ncbi:MAG: hypothetical protein LYZ69_04860 [Nitrososphaerales archaeon]|nr:hypothetical protein [Nitrososphaerales archaeon]
MIRRWAASTLAICGGALMVASGFGTRGFLLTALGIVEGEIPRYIGGVVGLTATLVVTALAILIALGGVTVALGGVALLVGHVSTGRFLVYIGGGTGFLGLLVSFAFAALQAGPAVGLSYAPYWAGLVLAIVARRIAK